MFNVNPEVGAKTQLYEKDEIKTENKQNKEITTDDKSVIDSSKADTLKNNDKDQTKEYKQGNAPVSISFDGVGMNKPFNSEAKTNEKEFSFVANSLDNKSDDKDINKVMEFISKIKDQELESVLKAFDEMMKHSQKLMEETKRYVQEKVIPKEEAMKVDTAKQEIIKDSVKH